MSDDVSLRDEGAVDGPSTKSGGSTLSAVGALMEERRRFESWLEALDARRAETPKHVFTRVHADYTARLDAVITALTSHVEGLRGELTLLATRIATLEEQRHRARDERAEAELRAHVGELAPDEWKEVSAARDAAIADVTARHDAAEHELRRTRELLADAERPATPVQSAPAVPPPTAADVSPTTPAAIRAAGSPIVTATAKSSATAGAAPVADAPEATLHVPAAEAQLLDGPPASRPGAAARRPGTASFDELAFLNSVVSNPGRAPAAASPPAPAAASVPVPVPVPARAVAPTAPPLPAPARSEPSPFRREAPIRASSDGIVNLGDAKGPQIEAKRGGSSLAANISGNNPIVLRDNKPGESAKSLKCSECGALNYPTEWYCERCGAELATL